MQDVNKIIQDIRSTPFSKEYVASAFQKVTNNQTQNSALSNVMLFPTNVWKIPGSNEALMQLVHSGVGTEQNLKILFECSLSAMFLLTHPDKSKTTNLIMQVVNQILSLNITISREIVRIMPPLFLPLMYAAVIDAKKCGSIENLKSFVSAFKDIIVPNFAAGYSKKYIAMEAMQKIGFDLDLINKIRVWDDKGDFSRYRGITPS